VPVGVSEFQSSVPHGLSGGGQRKLAYAIEHAQFRGGEKRRPIKRYRAANVRRSIRSACMITQGLG
jgi:hypothetical protein